MNPQEAYGVWAPEHNPWAPWVKPILFSIAEFSYLDDDAGPGEIPDIPWVDAVDPATAFVVDLPGADGVRFGLALARRGWWPVPLYNAVAGGSVGMLSDHGASLVDVAPIVRELRRATGDLQRLALAPDGHPAFLLDSSRRHGTGAHPMSGMFDNRSISLPTDFPSRLFLLSRGIRQVVLVQLSGTKPQEDLAHTLLAWQEGGLSILARGPDGAGPPEPIHVSRPSRFRLAWYRLLATAGLRRSPLGGFGGTIPEPSSG